MRTSRWITEATDTHLEYVTGSFIAFPRQQWLRERVSMLRYPYTACLVYYYSQVPVPELNLVSHARFSRSPGTSSHSK